LATAALHHQGRMNPMAKDRHPVPQIRHLRHHAIWV
jgi:hypothetical protein